MTVDKFFELSHQDRKQVEQMFPNRQQALGSKSPSPGSKPSGISKSRTSSIEKVAALLTAAQKIIATISSADDTASSKSGNSGKDSSSEGSSSGSSSNGGTAIIWEKQNGICLRTGLPVIPQGAVDGQIGKTFPRTRHVSPQGIKNNTGTRCYRSALLQCLFHTPEFCHLLGILHKDCQRKPAECITCAVQQMAQDYWNGNRNTNAVDDDSDLFDQALKKNIPDDYEIQNNEQSDPHHLMEYLVRFLEQDAFGINPTVDQYVSPRFDQKDDNSLSISKMFSFEYQVRWTCTECRKRHPRTTYYEPFLRLAVLNARPSGSTLESYFEDPQSNPFLVSGPFKCDSDICREKQRNPNYKVPDQTKRWKIVHAPEILIIQLNRIWGVFNRGKNAYVTRKATQTIKYGEELDLTQYSVRREDNINYELRGMVSHRGSTFDSGHYVAGVFRKGPRDTYSTINDTEVGRARQSPRPLLVPSIGDSYLLVYSRVAPAVEEGEEDDEGAGA